MAKPIRAAELLGKLERHLGLTWVRRVTASNLAEGPSMLASDLPRPSEAVLAALAELADAGRIRNLLEETGRLEQQESAFAPFFAHVRELSQRFQLKALRELLRQTPTG